MSDERYPLFLLACAGFVSGLTIRVAEPLLPRVAEDFGVGVAAASVLITSFTLAYGLFQLVHGPLGDRFGKLRTVAVSLLLASLASAACASAGSLEQLSLYRFLTGMTAGAVVPLSFAFVGDQVPFERRQAVLGRFIAGVLLGQTCGPLLGGLFSDFIGWRATFLVPGAGFLVLCVALARVAGRERPAADAGERPRVLATYARLLASRRSRNVCIAVGLEAFFFYGAFAYLGAFLREDFGLGFTAIGVIVAGFGVGGLVYSLLVRVLVHRLGPDRMVRAGAALLLACFALLAALPWWPLAPAAVVGLGLAYYMMHNTLQTLATEMAPQARGAAIAVFAFCLFFGQSLGVAAAGLGAQALGYRPVMAAAGVGLAALGAWLAGKVR